MGALRTEAAPEPAAVLATRLLQSFLDQVLRDGLYHADPHPGNLRVLPGGIVAPLDYGMFGQLDAMTRERIADLLSGARSIQILLAGKAHPKDDEAKHSLQALFARKGIPAPIQAGTRWVVERTHSWMNGYGKLRRCTERNAKIVDFYLYLAAALVTIRQLIQRARNSYRWDTRPTVKRLK